jgi:hypothetical protein
MSEEKGNNDDEMPLRQGALIFFLGAVTVGKSA